MVIQNISSAYNYEKNINIKDNVSPSNDEFITEDKKISKDDFTFSTPKTISTPTKIYVDKVIDNALKNISKGYNVEDNKRIVRLFSNLINENSENILRKAYGI